MRARSRMAQGSPRSGARWRSLGAAGGLLLVGAGTGFAQPDSTPPVDSSPPAIRLELNLPAARLHLFRRDTLIRRFPVAIGLPDYPTPLGDFAIGSVEWNPWWIPPSREWARGEKPTPPGPENPMGRVKLYFRPLYFLHGTPFERSIGRASSHGCVRLRNADAIELALMVMKEGKSEADSTVLALLVRDTVTTSGWLLDRPIPVRIVYRTVEVIADTLWLHPDPYRRGSASRRRVTDELRAAGVDGPFDAAAVDSAVTRVRASSIALPVGRAIKSPTRRRHRSRPRPR